jgi:hypothetical protein
VLCAAGKGFGAVYCFVHFNRDLKAALVSQDMGQCLMAIIIVIIMIIRKRRRKEKNK